MGKDYGLHGLTLGVQHGGMHGREEKLYFQSGNRCFMLGLGWRCPNFLAFAAV